MDRDHSRQGREQTLREYREAILAARDALDEMEKEIEKELGPESPDEPEK
jgi:hypothetical protein